MKRSRYDTSRNYGWLKELLDAGLEVVCFVDYKVDGMAFRDVCKAEYREGSRPEYSKYVLFARGIEYASWNPSMAKEFEKYPQSFEDMMQKHNVEYINIDQ